MSRRLHITAPFTGGMVTDRASYFLDANQSATAQDLVYPSGVAVQRRGWAYHGGTGVASVELCGVYRAKYVLNGNTRTMTTGENGKLYIHLGSGAATDMGTLKSNTEYLPRCMYRDELILCAQDGITPLRRYSGSTTTANITYTGTAVTGDNAGTVSGMTLASDPGVGAYCSPDIVANGDLRDIKLRLWHRIIESSTTSVTLEDIRFAVGVGLPASPAVRFEGLGFAFPCVSVYDAGTVTYTESTDNIDGFGTKWSTGATPLRGTVTDGADAILVMPPGANARLFEINAVTDDNDLTVYAGETTDISAKANYQALRRLPFKDAATHKQSLWGTGVLQHPNRVYVGPPGWNIALYPGVVTPLTIINNWASETNVGAWLMDFIDVPSPFDGDVNVAILSSPNPLLVLKRQAVYGIYGAWPNFEVALIDDGAGCIDIRSAISSEAGQFWAGEGGVYAYVGGLVRDLTEGRINREWRALTRQFNYTTDRVTIGEVYGHLVVRILTAGGTIDRTYVYNMATGTWCSRFSNVKPRYQFSNKVPDETESLLWVGDDHDGDVMDLAPAINLSGTYQDGDATKPRLQATTGSTFGSTTGLDEERRLEDLHIHANVLDSGAAGASAIDVYVDYSGGLHTGGAGTQTATLDSIQSDATDLVDLHMYGQVNVAGRLLAVRLDQDTTASTHVKTEIAQISATVTDTQERS